MLESQEVEEKLQKIFKKLEQKFNKLDRLEDVEEKRSVLDEVQPELVECKRYVDLAIQTRVKQMN